MPVKAVTTYKVKSPVFSAQVLFPVAKKVPASATGTFITIILLQGTLIPGILFFYLRISVTCPAPTVRPPSRIANFKPFSMAIG